MCGQVEGKEFGDIVEALSCSQEKRRNSSFVVMASEIDGMVGQFGVDAVVDNTLPDGTPYTWKKRRK